MNHAECQRIIAARKRFANSLITGTISYSELSEMTEKKLLLVEAAVVIGRLQAMNDDDSAEFARKIANRLRNRRRLGYVQRYIKMSVKEIKDFFGDYADLPIAALRKV